MPHADEYQPPHGPPPSWNDRYATSVAQRLKSQGWAVLNLGQHPHYTHGSDRTYQHHPEAWPVIDALFDASRSFFGQSDEEKAVYLTPDGSEEGFSSIKGEKEFITLRRNDVKHCPPILKEAAENAWRTVFQILNQTLRGFELEYGLPPTSLTRYSEPCLQMDDVPRATMLRLFRYENDEAKIVAEPHMDLGLLSLVIGDTPGLEAWDFQFAVNGVVQPPFWHPIERNFEQGMATLMSGRQLQYFTRDRCPPGGHRVVSYGKDAHLIPKNIKDLHTSKSKKILNRLSIGKSKDTPKEKYRYSIVFVLRAHEAVPVDYSSLESPGFTFDEKDKEARTAGELFRRIRKAHFNVNIGQTERLEQKRKLEMLNTVDKTGSMG